MYSLWRERNPDEVPFSEQRIADQALSLLRRGEFTAVELEELRRRVKGANTRVEDTSGTSPPSSLSPPHNQFVNSLIGPPLLLIILFHLIIWMVPAHSRT